MHADHFSPTKVVRSQTRMKRQVFPREPQVSVVTQTIYDITTPTSLPLPVKDVPIPFGPIVGGIAGGVLIVLLVVGGWWWWGSRMRASQAKGPKARRAQDLSNKSGHGKTQSTETLNTSASHTKSQSSHMSEKSASSLNHPPVKKPSEILAAQQKNSRPVLTHHATSSTTSLASSKYAPLRPSPLALNVVNRAPSAMSENPPTVLVTAPPRSTSPGLSPQSAALRSLVPLPPKVNVVPPSPPPPVRKLDAPVDERKARQSVQSVQSVQTVASDYSLDSPVGVAYGGDELAREVYVNPRDTWRESSSDFLARDPFASSSDHAPRR